MATVDKGGTVTLQELVVSSLAQTDAVAKLLIEKGVITQDEFMEKIKAEKLPRPEQREPSERDLQLICWEWVIPESGKVGRTANKSLTDPTP